MTCQHCKTGFCVKIDHYAEGIALIAHRCINCGWHSKGELIIPRPNQVDPDRKIRLWPMDDRRRNGHPTVRS